MAIEVTDRQGLERFLADKPAQWSRLVAARSALRVLPVALAGLPKQHWLPPLRACFISWAAGKYPAHNMKAAARSATLSANSAAFSAADSAADSAANSARSAARSALSANSAAFSAADSADSAANSATLSADFTALSAIWRTVSGDLSWLTDRGPAGLVENLALSPLWQGDPPRWALDSWQSFMAEKRASADGYAPWIAWYQALLTGDGASADHLRADLTIRIATQPDEWWNRPVRKINADIAAWVAEAIPRVPPNELEKQIDRLPLPGPAPHRMDLRDGRLHAEPVMADGPDAMAQVYLEELREKADDLLQELSAKNADPFVSNAVKRLLEALPAASSDVEPARVDARGLTIKSIADIYKAQGAEAELFAGAVAQINDVSLTVQRLCQCYPVFRAMELDALAMGITSEQAPSVASDAADIVAAMQGADICDATASEAFEEAVTAVREARTPSDASVFAARLLQLVRNALLILLRSSKKLADVAGTEIKTLAQDAYKDARPKLVKIGSRLILAAALTAVGSAAIPLGKLGNVVPQFKEIADVVKSLKDMIKD